MNPFIAAVGITDGDFTAHAAFWQNDITICGLVFTVREGLSPRPAPSAIICKTCQDELKLTLSITTGTGTHTIS